MEAIEFENRKYPIRQIEIDERQLIISSTTLNNILLNDNGAYKSNEAIYIDELIYFFVEPSILKLKSKDLIEYVKINCI